MMRAAETLCDHQHSTGYSCDGGFADYVIAHAGFATRLPEHTDLPKLHPSCAPA